MFSEFETCNNSLPLTTSHSRSLRVASWNIHGGLASKLLNPAFRSLLEAYDIVLLQETHLRPEQESQLALPNQFEIFV